MSNYNMTISLLFSQRLVNYFALNKLSKHRNINNLEAFVNSGHEGSAAEYAGY